MNLTNPLKCVFGNHSLLKNNKKGLSAPVINWIFVMVAGAVILLFIFKIIGSQGEITELEVSANLLEDMGSILVGRSVSENSFTEIDTPSDQIFLFKCEGFCNPNTGCESYVKSLAGDKQVETKVRPIFTAEKIKFTNKIYSFVESWKVPFNVVNFVYLAYPGQKFILQDGDTTGTCNINGCSGIENQIPEKIRASQIVINDPTDSSIQRSKFVKYVYFKEGCRLFSPPENQRSICIDDYEIYFWKKDETGTIALSDDFSDGTNSVYYLTDQEVLGAIFTDSAQTYECNMRKAQYKFSKSIELYQYKIVRQYSYNQYGNCANFYRDGIGEIFNTLNDYGLDPGEDIFTKFGELSGRDILTETELLNRKLMRNDCSPIY